MTYSSKFKPKLPVTPSTSKSSHPPQGCLPISPNPRLILSCDYRVIHLHVCHVLIAHTFEPERCSMALSFSCGHSSWPQDQNENHVKHFHILVHIQVGFTWWSYINPNLQILMMDCWLLPPKLWYGLQPTWVCPLGGPTSTQLINFDTGLLVVAPKTLVWFATYLGVPPWWSHINPTDKF